MCQLGKLLHHKIIILAARDIPDKGLIDLYQIKRHILHIAKIRIACAEIIDR